MLNVIAALALIGVNATAPALTGVATIAPPATMHGSGTLTAKQKRWFAHAVDHILRGDR